MVERCLKLSTLEESIKEILEEKREQGNVNRYIFYNCDLTICSYFRPIKSGGLFNVCLLERFKYTLSDLLRLLNCTVIGISSRGQCLGFLSQFLGRQNVSYP